MTILIFVFMGRRRVAFPLSRSRSVLS